MLSIFAAYDQHLDERNALIMARNERFRLANEVNFPATSCGIKPVPIAGNLAMCHIEHMDRDQIIAKLREHAPELKAAGVVHLFLHGSYARGTAIRGSSDVDVIAEFDPGRRLSLVDMVAIENRLIDLLGVRVDLSPAKTLKEPVRHKAKREAVLAF